MSKNTIIVKLFYHMRRTVLLKYLKIYLDLKIILLN